MQQVIKKYQMKKMSQTIKEESSQNLSLLSSASSQSSQSLISINSVIQFIKRNDIAVASVVGTLSAATAFYYFSIYNKNNNKNDNNNKKSHSASNNTNNRKNSLLPNTNTNDTTNNNNNNIQKHYQPQSKQIKLQLQQLKTRRQKLLKCAKQFKIQYVQQQILTSLLSQQCVLNIFDICTELVDEQQLNTIYQTNRKARRTVFPHILLNANIKPNNRRQSIQSMKSLQEQDNYVNIKPHTSRQSLPLNITSPKNIMSIKNKLKQKHAISYPQALSFSEVYYRFVCTFQEDFKYLIEKTQKDFAVFLNIDFSLITQSIDFHISKQDNDYFKQKIQEWTSMIKQSLKNKLYKYNQPIQPAQVCGILKSQIQYLSQKREKLMETIKKLGITDEDELDCLPPFLQSILQDEVFNKWGIEQQQMTVDMLQLSKNKELQSLVQEFQLLTQKIVQEMYEQVNREMLHPSDEQQQDGDNNDDDEQQQ